MGSNYFSIGRTKIDKCLNMEQPMAISSSEDENNRKIVESYGKIVDKMAEVETKLEGESLSNFIIDNTVTYMICNNLCSLLANSMVMEDYRATDFAISKIYEETKRLEQLYEDIGDTYYARITKTEAKEIIGRYIDSEKNDELLLDMYPDTLKVVAFKEKYGKAKGNKAK
ncbi:MAG: hypothetical protein K5666_02185 [Bacilli bacterium]|nr:hypothetical protein [Bacilli bacterium]